MRNLLLLLVAFPAYAAPVCNDEKYEPMNLTELNRNLEEVINDNEKICLVEYVWGNYIKQSAMFGVIGGGGGGGMIDLSPLSKQQRRDIQGRCEGKTDKCHFAAYGSVVWSKEFVRMWLFVPDKVVME